MMIISANALKVRGKNQKHSLNKYFGKSPNGGKQRLSGRGGAAQAQDDRVAPIESTGRGILAA